MALTAGTQLGPYRIVSALGAGGMGEVYKARDTRLDRTVAIKVLPAALAADPHFLERFDREARAISALEHPHICPLYDVGHEAGTRFLVMQHLEGETLSARLARGPLPLGQALQHAIEIASALDQAHSQGIAHRDLKPGNVMLARAGRQGAPEVKLLDFGLAKGLSDRGSERAALTAPPTMTTPLTAQGTIIGTFQYMAPEQLEGQEADSRSDIWAFGCVLYEMVTGRRAFEGKSQASLIGAIMKDDPPRIESVQPVAPRALDHVLRRCLAKDPEDRWQHIRDVRAQLAWIPASEPSAPVRRRGALLAWLAGAAVAGALLALAIASTVFRPHDPPLPPVTRFVVAPPDGTALVPGMPAVAADGSRIVFAAGARGGERQLYARPIDQPAAIAIPGTTGADQPFFSPDGQWLGFFADGHVNRIPAAGGDRTALSAASEPRGAAWAADGRIVFAPTAYSGLFTVHANGGTPQPLTSLDPESAELSHRYPQVLPDGRIVFGILTDRPDSPAIGIVDPGGGPHRVLLQPAMRPQYAPASGHLLYAVPHLAAGLPLMVERGAASVMAVRLRHGEIEGKPVPVAAGIAANTVWGLALFTTGPNGAFLSMAAPEAPLSRLVWVGRQREVVPLPLPARRYFGARVSPEGRSIATTIVDDDVGVWLADPARGVVQRLGSGLHPVWSPDGRELAVLSLFDDGPGIARLLLSAPEEVRRMTPEPLVAVPTGWHIDGDIVALAALSMVTRADVLTLSVSDGTVRTITGTTSAESAGRFSPDGTWLAFEAGDAVHVQPYPGPGRRVQVSPGAGAGPVWSPDGRELYYQRGSQLMAVPFSATDGVTGPPRMLFEHAGQLEDIAPDGRFLFRVPEREDELMRPLVAALGWLDRVLR